MRPPKVHIIARTEFTVGAGAKRERLELACGHTVERALRPGHKAWQVACGPCLDEST